MLIAFALLLFASIGISIFGTKSGRAMEEILEKERETQKNK